MRTLREITDAARRNEDVEITELRYAIAAYDVLLAKMGIDKEPERVKVFMEAATQNPKEYIGWDNDPKNHEFVDWHKSYVNVDLSINDIIQHTKGVV